MKRLAARDFEDLLQVHSSPLSSVVDAMLNSTCILQCAIPVFEGLLPAPHDNIILDLLFDLATWQGFAKLRMHTDDTLAFFDTATTTLGKSVRKFERHTCAYYQTTELPQEYAARGQRHAALVAKQPRASGPGTKTAPTLKIKKLNLSTYKYHALGDYPNTIRQYGTTDSYSTQTVCMS